MSNVESLKSFITAFIASQYGDLPPTEAQFNEAADTVRQANSSILPISDLEFENLKRKLRESIVVTLDNGICLKNQNNGHTSWLPARRAEIDSFFWKRYKDYLEQVKHWNPRVTAKLGQVSDEILDECCDPQGDDCHIRGLVIGDVQSGKTSNYTALANKAADVGYNLVIILSGIPELLRQQTQKRLDLEFCGRKSNLYLDPNKRAVFTPVGVGKFGYKKTIACFTSEDNDFNATVLNSNGLSLSSVNGTILLVVKKNATILRNLYTWLKHNNELNANGEIDKSLLLIDDEADNASVNTSNPDTDPKAINKAIRVLLTVFSRTTYLAVTATPFANIFIHPTKTSDVVIKDKEGNVLETVPNVPDLFPADFIYALDAPSNYIGAERIFSVDGDQQGIIESIDVDDFYKYFPDKHKKELVVEGLPLDLYKSLNYFLLANAIRDIRGDISEHRSMMIHVSRFTLVQNQISSIVLAWLEQIKSDLINYAALPLADSEKIESIHNLHVVWDEFKLENKASVTWAEILSKYLYKAVAPIEVRTINSESGATSLDYDKHNKDGLRVIAIGGNILSRGLTLEGLMTTYFCRNTNMYDTLMQMGRWFGYRPNYDDLVKIWITEETKDWYGYIQKATRDLRDQIKRMKMTNLSPKEFGLKVMHHPDSLIVTARNKMKTAKLIKCPVHISGHLLETPRLVASVDTLEKNAIVIERYINRLSTDGTRVSDMEDITHGNYFWKGVPSESVSELLANFITHPWHLSYNGKAISEFVAKHVWQNGWDVVLITNGDGGPFNKSIKCGNELLSISNTESRFIQINDKMLSVSGSKLRVGSGGCARIGLNNEQLDEAKEKYMATYTGKKKNPSLPDSAYMIKSRNPILMIHIIEAKYSKDNTKFPPFLYCLGVGIPADDKDDDVAEYQVNLVELKNWLDPTEEEDE